MKRRGRDIVDYWRAPNGGKMTPAEIDAKIAELIRQLDRLREVRAGKRKTRSIRIKARLVHYRAGAHYRNIALGRKKAA